MSDRQRTRRGLIPTESETEPMGGLLVRLGWLVVAPLALLAIGGTIASNDLGLFSWHSAVYWGLVIGALALRYVDVFKFKGDTASGEPASPRDWHRYSLSLPAVALAVWAVAVWSG